MQNEADRRIIAEFDDRGFVVIPNALTPTEVRTLNAAFDRYIADYPDEWAHFSPSFIQTVDVLPRTDAFDRAIENPQILRTVQKLLRDDIAFEELSLMIRNPTDTTGELKGWHRDIIRSFERRHEINAISVVYYLTDVTERDHCFSIVPQTHAGRVDMRPEEVLPGMEFDALGPAGSAFVFHARCIHAGKLKLGSAPRRTMHLYYGPADAPRTSEWTSIPPRLADKHDPALPPRLYAKANRADIIDGTGFKPRDVDPAMNTAEMLMHLQRRVNAPRPTAR